MLQATIRIDGIAKLLMHNDTLADPLLPETKEFKKISGKRAKTDADYEEMARLEFAAGLYVSDGRVVIPSQNIMRCLIEGARINKMGPKIERGLNLVGTTFLLEYDGPKDIDGLYADRKNWVNRMTVKVGTSRTVRCRPQFPQWALTVPAVLDDSVLDLDDLRQIAENAGAFIGLGDFRKGGGFGRFNATVTPA